MNLREMKRIVLLFATIVLLLAAGAARAANTTAEGSFTRTLKVSGAVDLDVKTGSGSIKIRTGDASTVQILGRIRASNSWSGGISAEEKVRRLEANPPIQQTGSIIVIGQIEDRDLQNNVSISYERVVPAATKLRSHTGSGSIEADGVSLRLRLSARRD